MRLNHGHDVNSISSISYRSDVSPVYTFVPIQSESYIIIRLIAGYDIVYIDRCLNNYMRHCGQLEYWVPHSGLRLNILKRQDEFSDGLGLKTT